MHIALIYLAKFFNVLLFVSNEHGEKKDTLLSVEPGLMIWTVVIFIILLLILKKYAWGPLLKSLGDREQGIKDSVEKAENLKLEAEKILEEHKKLLASADEEARKQLNDSKQLAEKLRQELMAKANEDANKVITRAKAEIEREKIAALNQLKDEIASLAVGAAEKILDENLDAGKQKRIIDAFINQIPKN